MSSGFYDRELGQDFFHQRHEKTTFIDAYASRSHDISSSTTTATQTNKKRIRPQTSRRQIQQRHQQPRSFKSANQARPRSAFFNSRPGTSRNSKCLVCESPHDSYSSICAFCREQSRTVSSSFQSAVQAHKPVDTDGVFVQQSSTYLIDLKLNRKFNQLVGPLASTTLSSGFKKQRPHSSAGRLQILRKLKTGNKKSKQQQQQHIPSANQLQDQHNQGVKCRPRQYIYNTNNKWGRNDEHVRMFSDNSKFVQNNNSRSGIRGHLKLGNQRKEKVLHLTEFQLEHVKKVLDKIPLYRPVERPHRFQATIQENHELGVACVKIQAIVRRFQRRAQYLRHRGKFISVQALFRGYLTRTKGVIFRLRLEKTSAAKIQKSVRTSQIRRGQEREEDKRKASTLIQTHIRAMFGKKIACKWWKQIVLIQRIYRGSRSRTRIRKRHAVARKMQAWWRLALERLVQIKLEVLNTAATRIQSIFRRELAARQIIPALEQRAKERQVVVLQRQYRGYVVRQYAKELRRTCESMRVIFTKTDAPASLSSLAMWQYFGKADFTAAHGTLEQLLNSPASFEPDAVLLYMRAVSLLISKRSELMTQRRAQEMTRDALKVDSKGTNFVHRKFTPFERIYLNFNPSLDRVLWLHGLAIRTASDEGIKSQLVSSFGVAIWLLTRDKRRALPYLAKAVSISPGNSQVLSNLYGKSFQTEKDIEIHLGRASVTSADFPSFAPYAEYSEDNLLGEKFKELKRRAWTTFTDIQISERDVQVLMFVRSYQKCRIAPDVLVLVYVKLPTSTSTQSAKFNKDSKHTAAKNKNEDGQEPEQQRILQLLLPSDTLTNWIEWLDVPSLLRPRSRQAMCKLLLNGLFLTSRSPNNVKSLPGKRSGPPPRHRGNKPTNVSLHNAAIGADSTSISTTADSFSLWRIAFRYRQLPEEISQTLLTKTGQHLCLSVHWEGTVLVFDAYVQELKTCLAAYIRAIDVKRMCVDLPNHDKLTDIASPGIDWRRRLLTSKILPRVASSLDLARVRLGQQRSAQLVAPRVTVERVFADGVESEENTTTAASFVPAGGNNQDVVYVLHPVYMADTALLAYHSLHSIRIQCWFRQKQACKLVKEKRYIRTITKCQTFIRGTFGRRRAYKLSLIRNARVASTLLSSWCRGISTRLRLLPKLIYVLSGSVSLGENGSIRGRGNHIPETSGSVDVSGKGSIGADQSHSVGSGGSVDVKLLSSTKSYISTRAINDELNKFRASFISERTESQNQKKDCAIQNRKNMKYGEKHERTYASVWKAFIRSQVVLRRTSDSVWRALMLSVHDYANDVVGACQILMENLKVMIKEFGTAQSVINSKPDLFRAISLLGFTTLKPIVLELSNKFLDQTREVDPAHFTYSVMERQVLERGFVLHCDNFWSALLLGVSKYYIQRDVVSAEFALMRAASLIGVVNMDQLVEELLKSNDKSNNFDETTEMIRSCKFQTLNDPTTPTTHSKSANQSVLDLQLILGKTIEFWADPENPRNILNRRLVLARHWTAIRQMKTQHFEAAITLQRAWRKTIRPKNELSLNEIVNIVLINRLYYRRVARCVKYTGYEGRVMPFVGASSYEPSIDLMIWHAMHLLAFCQTKRHKETQDSLAQSRRFVHKYFAGDRSPEGRAAVIDFTAQLNLLEGLLLVVLGDSTESRLSDSAASRGEQLLERSRAAIGPSNSVYLKSVVLSMTHQVFGRSADVHRHFPEWHTKSQLFMSLLYQVGFNDYKQAFKHLRAANQSGMVDATPHVLRILQNLTYDRITSEEEKETKRGELNRKDRASQFKMIGTYRSRIETQRKYTATYMAAAWTYESDQILQERKNMELEDISELQLMKTNIANLAETDREIAERRRLNKKKAKKLRRPESGKTKKEKSKRNWLGVRTSSKNLLETTTNEEGEEKAKRTKEVTEKEKGEEEQVVRKKRKKVRSPFSGLPRSRTQDALGSVSTSMNARSFKGKLWKSSRAMTNSLSKASLFSNSNASEASDAGSESDNCTCTETAAADIKSSHSPEGLIRSASGAALSSFGKTKKMLSKAALKLGGSSARIIITDTSQNGNESIGQNGNGTIDQNGNGSIDKNCN